MKRTAHLLLRLTLVVGGCAVAAPDSGKTFPQEALEGAAVAARVLGEQVMRGNYSYPVQRMYPRWRKRAAIRHGGEDKLEKKLMEVPEQMRKNGISMLSFEVGQPRSGHEVFLLRGVGKDGEPIQTFLEWLVFVPTRTVYRVIDAETRQARRIERKGYQVAIAKKGTKDWYFIDGSNLTIPELRSFFPSLPEEKGLLGVPPVGGEELKD